MPVAARRRREKQERRCAILDAAEQVFLSKSVRDATMDEIARAAELSKGTLYLYFDSKDDLFLAIACRALESLLTEFEAVKAESPRGADRVRRLMRTYGRFAMDNRERYRVAMSWLFDDDPAPVQSPQFAEHQQLLRSMAGHLVEAIALGQSDGSVRSDYSPSRLAVQLWGGMLGLLLLNANVERVAKRAPFELDITAAVPAYVDLAMEAIQLDPPHAQVGAESKPGRGAREAS
jgi:AcrR family transcriptional regulator